ncbi:hypothetical protein SESBI_47311 [Sesbania bispinosa]|nr:hypothetical protein SESBI_47311 [Sesbania bispinosa]
MPSYAIPFDFGKYEMDEIKEHIPKGCASNHCCFTMPKSLHPNTSASSLYSFNLI